MRGTASEVGGIVSATSNRKTVRDSRMVTPTAANETTMLLLLTRALRGRKLCQGAI